MAKRTFVFYENWKSVIDELSKDVQLEIYQAIAEYALNGNLLELKPMAKIAFAFIKQDLDRDAKAYTEKCRRNKENGMRGGAPKGNKNASRTTETTERLKEQPKQPYNDNDNDNDINNDINNSNELFVEVPEEPRHNPDDPIDYKKLIDYFNDETKGVFGKIKYPLSDKRKGHIRARIREHGKDAMAEVIKKATASSFLKGSSGKFKATFDWMILPTNFEKILSGNFDEQANEKGKQRYVVS